MCPAGRTIDRTPVLRAGVTGHRTLLHEIDLVDPVRRALRRLRDLAGPGVRFAIVSPLAEGADQLVAREALTVLHAELEVPLPMERDLYLETDFRNATTRDECVRLLAEASDVVTLPPCATPEDSYVQLGEYLIDHVQVLIAVWNGQPGAGRGGTADVVGEARRRSLPLFWILSEPPYSVIEERSDAIGFA